MSSIFIRLDCDNVGDKIEHALYRENPEFAQEISNSIKKNIKWIIKKFKLEFNAEILLTGSDDLLIEIDSNQYDIIKIENLKNQFLKKSGITISIGIGKTITESVIHLNIAKVSGKNKIVY